jgi:hypothetical protein
MEKPYPKRLLFVDEALYTGSLQRHMQLLVSIVVEKKKPKNHFFKYLNE